MSWSHFAPFLIVIAELWLSDSLSSPLTSCLNTAVDSAASLIAIPLLLAFLFLRELP